MSKWSEYYWSNPERNRAKSREKMRAWRAANPERAREHDHAYYEAHKEHLAELQRERRYWRQLDELNRRRYSCG